MRIKNTTTGSSFAWTKKLFLTAALAAASLLSAKADIVLVTARTSAAGVTAAPTYTEFGNGSSWANSSAETPNNGAASGCRFISKVGASFSMRPVLATAGGTYRVEVAKTTTTAAGTTNKVTYFATNATMVINGTTATNAFQTGSGSGWIIAGTITLGAGVTTPDVTVLCTAGAGSSGRFYADAMQFTELGNPCIGVADVGGVNGPLYAGVSSIEVFGLDVTATAVKVYGVVTGGGGHTNLLGTATVSAVTSATVPVTGLLKGDVVWATQVIGGIEGCIKTAGTLAGGGPSPRVRVATSINTSGSGVYFLGSNSRTSGFGSAPSGGTVVNQSGCWQTVSFDGSTGDWFGWSSTLLTNPPSGTLNFESIALAIDDTTDPGPYEVYIDDLKTNGVLVTDWESATLGTASFFQQPSFSGTTSGYLLNGNAGGTIRPNITEVVDTESYSGTKSLHVNWQFKDGSGANWVRLFHNATDISFTTNSTVSFKILVLPTTQSRANKSIASHPASQTVVAGNSATMSVTMVHATNTFTYQWQKNGANIVGATDSAYTINPTTMADSGSFTVNVTDGACTQVTASKTGVLTVVEMPVITGQPTGVSTNADARVTFSATATGGALSYQWRKNGSNVSDGAGISGATTASLVLSNVFAATAGTYDVVVTNLAGSVTSDPAVLAVTDPAILTQPVSLTRGEGTNAIFSVTATGTATVTYQWRKDGGNISGATASSLTINPVSADAGSYDVVVTSGAPASLTSSVATLTVIVKPTITSQPSSATVEINQPASFTVASSGSPVTYQWKKNGVNISGQTTDTLSFATAQQADEGTYTVVLDNFAGSATSDPATLTVNGPPFITSQPASQSIGAGTNAVFSVTHSGTPTFTYQWKKNGVNISGETTTALTLAAVSQADAASYTVGITNSYGGVESTAGVLTVIDPPVISANPSSQTVMANDPVSFSVSATGTAPFAYQWKKNGVNISAATDSSYAIGSATLADAATYSVTVSNLAAVATSSGATLVVNQAPVIGTQPANQISKINSNATFSVVATGYPAVAYQWRKNGANIGGATAATYTISSMQRSDVATYSVVITNDFGSVTSSDATLIANGVLIFTDNFETGTAANWTPRLNFETNMLTVVNTNATLPSGGTYSAKQTNSQSRIHRNIVADNGGAEVDGTSKVSFYMFDGTGNNTGNNRVGMEVRGYSGGNGIQNGTGTTNGTLAQLLAIGKFNAVTAPGQVFDATKYQCRVAFGDSSTAGWYNLNASRSVGWHKFTIERLADGTTIQFSVDGVLDRTVTLATAVTWDTINFGFISGTVNGDVLYDNVVVEQVVSPTSITTQPATQTVDAGSNVNLSVVASGSASFNYQWRKNGSNIPAATTSSLALNGVLNADEGSYSVVVTGDGGIVTSSDAVLTVNDPAISSQPASLTVTSYDSASFSVTAAGTTLAYQWQKNGGNITGETTSSYTIASAIDTDAASYRVLVTGLDGTVSSSDAVLTVNPASSTVNVTANNTTYDGNPQGGSASATGAGGLNQSLTVSYSGRNATTYGPTTTAPTDAGDYTASATFAGDANHSGSSNSADYSIAQAGSSTTVTANDATYDGNTHGATAQATGAGGLNDSVAVSYTGTPLAGGSYGPTATAPTAPGSYTASATFAGDVNHTGSSDSKGFNITISDSDFPTLVVKAPKAGLVLTGAVPSLVITGTVTDVTGPTTVSVKYSINGGSFTPVANTAFVKALKPTNWWDTVTVSSANGFVPGTNRLVIKAVDIAGNETVGFNTNIYWHVTMPITLTINGQGEVDNKNKLIDAGNATNFFVGRNYTLSTKVGAGTNYVLTNITYTAENPTESGEMLVNTALAKKPTINFNMKTNMVITFNFIQNPAYDHAGTYNGLFHESGGYAHTSAGFVTLKLSSKFKASGKIYIEGASFGLTCNLNLNGVGSATVDRSEVGKSTLDVNLTADWNNEQIVGTISNSVASGWVADLTTYRTPFDKTINIATAYTNAYTVVIPGFSDAANGPVGYSYAAGTVKADASTAFKGLTSDGFGLSSLSARLSAAGKYPFYASSYVGQGEVIGWLDFTGTVGHKTPSGELSWIKTAGSTNYLSGFTNLAVSVVGSCWTNAAVGVRAMDFTGGTGLMTFSDSDIATTNVVVTVGTDNKMSVDLTLKKNFASKLSTKDGVWSGTFQIGLDPTQKTKFFGAMLQDLNYGRGFFVRAAGGTAVVNP